MMKKTTAEQEVSLTFHIVCLLVNFIALKQSFLRTSSWFTFQRHGGQWKYMSHLLMYLNMAYSIYAVAVDIYCIIFNYTCKPQKQDEEEADERPKPVKIRDHIFTLVCFPFGLAHGVAFMALTCIDSSLFVSMINRRTYPLTSMYMIYLHVWPLGYSLIESALVYHKYTSCKKAHKIPAIIGTVYAVWLLWIAFFGSYWSYPFLRRAKVLFKLPILAAIPALAAGCYHVGKKLTGKLWLEEDCGACCSFGGSKTKTE
eukprot:gene4780-5407_t